MYHVDKYCVCGRDEASKMACMLSHRGTVLSCVGYISASQCNVAAKGEYLKAMNSLYFLLEDFINQTVLLHNGDAFECSARDGDSIKRSTSPYTKHDSEHIVLISPKNALRKMRKHSGEIAVVRTRNVLYE
jgi:hypothetical protein